MSIIRVATGDDAAAVQAIYAPYVRETVISFEQEPPSVEAMRERILAAHGWLLCETDLGDAAGYAYASKHRDPHAYQWSVNVTVYVARDYHRRGVGRALYSTLFALLRQMGFYNAFAGIALPNEGSVGLHQSMGFTKIGVYPHVGYKFGQWRDVLWLGLPLRAFARDDAPPSSPRRLDEIGDIAPLLTSGLDFLRL